jgi:hypothetical protein
MVDMKAEIVEDEVNDQANKRSRVQKAIDHDDLS